MKATNLGFRVLGLKGVHREYIRGSYTGVI